MTTQVIVLDPEGQFQGASYIHLETEVGKMWGSSDTAYETKMSFCLDARD